MAEEEGSSLSRWSRRKAVARSGVQQPKVPAASPTQASTAPSAQAVLASDPAVQEPPAAAPPVDARADQTASPTPVAPPTLADVATLTRDSDFSRFVAGNVSPEVKNAALKQLFTDPHFNVMDGLDIYIGDYNTPDPLPPGMLRQMVQSQLLGIFDDEKPDHAAAATPALDATPNAASTPTPDESVDPALTVSTEPTPTDRIAPPPNHEDPDLQLQPDDATGRPAVAAGAGEDPGRTHRGP